MSHAELSFPDVVLRARRVHTLGKKRQRIDAITISAGQVSAVGPARAASRARGRAVQICNLGDAVITPGLVDCHTHFLYWALGRDLVIDVGQLTTLDAVLHKIRTEARKKRLGDWVMARGFEHNRWAGGLPSAADLDRAVADRPVLVRSRDSHTVWLNSVALRRAGISASTPDPQGGCYLRDEGGRPTGIVQETAIEELPNPLRELALRFDPEATRIIDLALRAAYRAAWALGIVGVHSMDDGPSLFHFARQRQQGLLGVRIVHAVQLSNLKAAESLGLRSGFGDEWLRVGGLKIFTDGALGSQTAHMLEPYPGRGQYCGVPTHTEHELQAVVREAAEHGWAVWVHAIGDRAVRNTINAIVNARHCGPPTLPHRIEHAQCVRPVDIRRMARAGIIASVQPCHILGDIPNADAHWPRARRHAFPLRALRAAGVTLAGGSDVPIETIDPRRSLFAATMRTDERGQPRGGWYPAQRISALEALRAFTQGAANSISDSNGPGTLEPGAPADLTIWDEDPLAVPPERLLEIGIRGCMVGGRLHLTDSAT